MRTEKVVSTTKAFDQGWTVIKAKWREIFPIFYKYFFFVLVVQLVLEWIFPGSGKQDEFSTAGFFPSLIGTLATSAAMIAGVREMYPILSEKTVVESRFTFAAVLALFFAQVVSIFLILLGLLALVIPGIFLWLSFSQTNMLVAVKNQGTLEALSEGIRITKGIKGEIFLFMAFSVVVFFLGVLALGVGVLVAVPLILVAQIYFFEQVMERAGERKEVAAKGYRVERGGCFWYRTWALAGVLLRSLPGGLRGKPPSPPVKYCLVASRINSPRPPTNSLRSLPGGQVVRRHTLDVVTVGSNPTQAAK